MKKNTYNVDSLIQEDPEVIKTIMLKVSKTENSIKEKENSDIANNELDIITTILKDESIFNQIKEKQLITKNDLSNSINIFKGTENKSIEENVKELETIVEKIEKMEVKEKEGIKITN